MYKNCLIIDTEQTYGDVGYVVTQETKIASFGQFIIENLFKQSEGSDGYKRKLKRYQEMVKEPEKVTINDLFNSLNTIIHQYNIDTIVCHSLAADKKVFASWALDRDVQNPFLNSNLQLYDSTIIAKALLGKEHKEYGLEYTIGNLYGKKIKQRHTGLDDASLTALMIVGAFYYQNSLFDENAIVNMIDRTKQLICAYFAAQENLYILVEQATYYQEIEEKVLKNYEIANSALIDKIKEMQLKLDNITNTSIKSINSVIEKQVESFIGTIVKNNDKYTEQLTVAQAIFANQMKNFQNKCVNIEDSIIEKQNLSIQLDNEIKEKQQKIKNYKKETQANKAWRWISPIVGAICGALTYVLLFVL